MGNRHGNDTRSSSERKLDAMNAHGELEALTPRQTAIAHMRHKPYGYMNELTDHHFERAQKEEKKRIELMNSMFGTSS